MAVVHCFPYMCGYPFFSYLLSSTAQPREASRKNKTR